MAEINNEQRKALSKIVEQNGTYSEFYKTRYEAKDAALVKANAKDIALYDTLSDAAKAVEAEREKERNALDAKYAKLKAEADRKAEVVSNRLAKAGLTHSYSGYGSTREYKWEADTGRFHNEYNAWQRALIAEIWATDNAKAAHKAVVKFLTGIGKDEPVVQEATV